MTVADRIFSLGLALPKAPVPVASYVPVRQTGDLAFTSGQTPTRDGSLVVKGKLGREVSIADGQRGARVAVLNCLATLAEHLGSLDRVAAVVKLTGYVASAEGFSEQPEVVNGASSLLEQIFGDAGRHARASLGVAELPGGAPVEIELIVQVRW